MCGDAGGLRTLGIVSAFAGEMMGGADCWRLGRERAGIAVCSDKGDDGVCEIFALRASVPHLICGEKSYRAKVYFCLPRYIHAQQQIFALHPVQKRYHTLLLLSIPPLSGIAFFTFDFVHPHIHPHPKFPPPPYDSYTPKKGPPPYWKR